jgi:hypothetical protein
MSEKLVKVPTGQIIVIATSIKDRTSTKRVQIWDARWKPSLINVRELVGVGRLRSISKLSPEDAILRLKYKVSSYFGGSNW